MFCISICDDHIKMYLFGSCLKGQGYTPHLPYQPKELKQQPEATTFWNYSASVTLLWQHSSQYWSQLVYSYCHCVPLLWEIPLYLTFNLLRLQLKACNITVRLKLIDTIFVFTYILYVPPPCYHMTRSFIISLWLLCLPCLPFPHSKRIPKHIKKAPCLSDIQTINRMGWKLTFFLFLLNSSH